MVFHSALNDASRCCHAVVALRVIRSDGVDELEDAKRRFLCRAKLENLRSFKLGHSEELEVGTSTEN